MSQTHISTHTVERYPDLSGIKEKLEEEVKFLTEQLDRVRKQNKNKILLQAQQHDQEIERLNGKIKEVKMSKEEEIYQLKNEQIKLNYEIGNLKKQLEYKEAKKKDGR